MDWVDPRQRWMRVQCDRTEGGTEGRTHGRGVGLRRRWRKEKGDVKGTDTAYQILGPMNGAKGGRTQIEAHTGHP